MLLSQKTQPTVWVSQRLDQSPAKWQMQEDFGVKRALGINWYTDCKSTQFVSCSVSTERIMGLMCTRLNIFCGVCCS